MQCAVGQLDDRQDRRRRYFMSAPFRRKQANAVLRALPMKFHAVPVAEAGPDAPHAGRSAVAELIGTSTRHFCIQPVDTKREFTISGPRNWSHVAITRAAAVSGAPDGPPSGNSGSAQVSSKIFLDTIDESGFLAHMMFP